MRSSVWSISAKIGSMAQTGGNYLMSNFLNPIRGLQEPEHSYSNLP